MCLNFNSLFVNNAFIIIISCSVNYCDFVVQYSFKCSLCFILLLKGVVQADFAFFDPKPNDFHGLKVLLQTYLDDKEWDLSGFVDIILAQTTVGSVVKIEDDEDEGVYGFVSALNMGRYKASVYLSICASI